MFDLNTMRISDDIARLYLAFLTYEGELFSVETDGCAFWTMFVNHTSEELTTVKVNITKDLWENLNPGTEFGHHPRHVYQVEAL